MHQVNALTSDHAVEENREHGRRKRTTGFSELSSNSQPAKTDLNANTSRLFPRILVDVMRRIRDDKAFRIYVDESRGWGGSLYLVIVNDSSRKV